MIQKVNISELLRLGAERVEKAKVQLTTTLPPPIRKVVDTAGTFGLCVNDCFENKNAQGFCFDRKEYVSQEKVNSTRQSSAVRH